MFDIVCVGFTCLDIPVLGDITPGIFEVDSTHVDKISMAAGGDAVNEVITCSSLGLNAAIVSYVGSDHGGRVLVDALNNKGVDTSGIEIFEGYASQTAIPLIDKTGERHFLFNSGCSSEFTGLNVDYNKYYQTKILTIASFFVAKKFDQIGVPQILRGAKEHNVLTVADTCCDVMGLGIDNIKDVLPYIDFFMPSYEEAAFLTGEKENVKIAEYFLKLGAKNVVLKLGAAGCFVKTATEEFAVPAFLDTKVVDTTGCGDNFVAGFCCGLYHELPLRDCAVFASATAAINAGFIGGSGGLGAIEEVLEFLGARGITIAGLRE